MNQLVKWQREMLDNPPKVIARSELETMDLGSLRKLASSRLQWAENCQLALVIGAITKELGDELEADGDVRHWVYTDRVAWARYSRVANDSQTETTVFDTAGKEPQLVAKIVDKYPTCFKPGPWAERLGLLYDRALQRREDRLRIAQENERLSLVEALS